MSRPPRRRPVRRTRKRSHAFRAIAVLVLLLGTAGGGYLGLHRQHQKDVAAEEARLSVDAQLNALDEMSLYSDRASSDQAVLAAKAKAAANATADSAKAKKAADMAKRLQAASRSQERTTPPDYGPIPSSCKAFDGNRATGCALMLEWGFALDQMPCLDNMWTKESNWRTTAENPGSGAYGIPQALPADKLSKYGSDWRTNPVPQIKWGLDYIKDRYKTPCGAWDFWLAHNWY